MTLERDSTTQYQAALLTVQEAAKQTGTIVPILQAAYFASISISNMRAELSGRLSLGFLFIVPALLWLISLFLAIRIFVPPLVRDTGTAAYERVVRQSYRLLNISQYTLMAGLLVMIINVFIYFVVLVPTPSSPPVMAVGTPTPTATSTSTDTPTPLPTATFTPMPTATSTP